MISDEDASCCGLVLFGAIIIILACIGFTIQEHYAKQNAMAHFQTITVPIDGAIVNTYGHLSAVWVKAENNSLVPVSPSIYLPEALKGEWIGTPMNSVPILFDDAPNKKSQTLSIKAEDGYLYYELHLIKDTKPTVNSASHGKWGEY